MQRSLGVIIKDRAEIIVFDLFNVKADIWQKVNFSCDMKAQSKSSINTKAETL
jgi:hypothetical protein